MIQTSHDCLIRSNCKDPFVFRLYVYKYWSPVVVVIATEVNDRVHNKCSNGIRDIRVQ